MRAGKERRKEMGGRDEEGPERDEGGEGMILSHGCINRH